MNVRSVKDSALHILGKGAVCRRYVKCLGEAPYESLIYTAEGSEKNGFYGNRF